jgi:hypothetical protein
VSKSTEESKLSSNLRAPAETRAFLAAHGGKVKAELRELGKDRQRSLRGRFLAGCLGGICGHITASLIVYQWIN